MILMLCQSLCKFESWILSELLKFKIFDLQNSSLVLLTFMLYLSCYKFQCNVAFRYYLWTHWIILFCLLQKIEFPLLGPFQRRIRYECIYKQYLMPSTYVYQLNFSLYLLLIDIFYVLFINKNHFFNWKYA